MIPTYRVLPASCPHHGFSASAGSGQAIPLPFGKRREEKDLLTRRTQPQPEGSFWLMESIR